MKLQRLTREESDAYGSGSGTTQFRSDLFRVVVMKLKNGYRTTLHPEHGHFNEIWFAGDQLENLNTNEKCLAQLEPNDLRKMISATYERAFREGATNKAMEIQEVLML